MATIQFSAKPETIRNVDGTPAYQRIKVPVLARRHCDMAAFGRSPKYGWLVNSDLFPNALAGIKRNRLGDYVRLDRIPAGVTVDTSGFLAVVSLEA